MAVAFVNSSRAINLDSSVSTLVVPITLAHTSNQTAVVHIAILSAGVTVLSVTDNGAVTPNTYTYQTGINASYTPGNRTFGGAAAGFPGGDSDFNWPADIQTTADQLTQGVVRGEVWTTGAGSTPTLASSLTVTLSGPAKCAVEVIVYSGGTSIAAITAANAVALASTSAPTIAVTVTAGSFLSAGFSSQSCLNQAAIAVNGSIGPIKTGNTNTVRSEMSGASSYPLSVTAADSTGLTAAVVGISPTNTESTDISISSGTQNAQLIPVPATYAVCAVEVKA